MVICWPASNSPVQSVAVFSTVSTWSRQMKEPWSLRMSPPSRRPASVSIWKPLQMPSTGMPAFAAATTSVMIGLSEAIAPQRR
ncbi:hypothetical protein ASE14_10035 [Agromyces sp. Root81]|nr:hypothetical protein ASE14_10035 [Agromyces sp. Root81]